MPPPLPPGQRAVVGFPRFGTHLHQRAPDVPPDAGITFTGDGIAPWQLPRAAFAELARREQVSDLHCVAGWSATGLRWEGVPFAELHARWLAQFRSTATTVSHFVFEGWDGYRCVVEREDALAADVLVADRLDGQLLTAEHGAPLRLVSPSQYGFVSVKHLRRVELHDGEPGEEFGSASALGRALMLPPLFARHPRSRVWLEERNRRLPAALVRPIYRGLIPPIRWLSARGRRG